MPRAFHRTKKQLCIAVLYSVSKFGQIRRCLETKVMHPYANKQIAMNKKVGVSVLS
jgi:hypothetical protein